MSQISEITTVAIPSDREMSSDHDMPSHHNIADESRSHETPYPDQPEPANILASLRPYNFRHASHSECTITKFPVKPPTHNLLTLPAEIRTQIWTYVLRTHTVIRPVHRFCAPAIPPHNTHALALLKTCRQTRSECIPVFYGAKSVHLGGNHHVLKWLKSIGQDARSHVAKVEFTVQKWRYISSAGGLGGEERRPGAEQPGAMDLLASCERLKEARITFAEEALVKAHRKTRARYVGRGQAKREWRAEERERVKALGWLGIILPGFKELVALKALEALEVRLWPRCVYVWDEARRELKRMLRSCMAEGCDGGLGVYAERGGALAEIENISLPDIMM